MRTIEVTEVAEILDAALGTPYLNVLFVGGTGCGKTSSVKQWAKDRGVTMCSVNMSAIDPVDSLGIPVRAQREFNGVVHETTKTAVPEWVFTLAEAEKGVLFLDELLCAEPSTLNAFLNFLSEKEVDGIDLSHVLVVGATNIAQYTYDPDAAILARFAMFEVVNDSFEKHVKRVTGQEVAMGTDLPSQEQALRQTIVFEPRPLVPRCYEALCWLKAKGVDPAPFYEGFTNCAMRQRYHWRDDVDVAVGANVVEGEVPAERLAPLATTIETACKRVKDANLRRIVDDIVNVSVDKDELFRQVQARRIARRQPAQSTTW